MAVKTINARCSTIAIVLLLVIINSASAKQELCRNISGTWFNELGSRIVLSQSGDEALRGQYWTAVERSTETSRTNHSDIVGTAPYKEQGSVLAFSVMWYGGQSMTSWTGQCLICGDEEEIQTTWLLRSRIDNCGDKWKSTLIGQNTFTRKQQIVIRQNTRNKRSIEAASSSTTSRHESLLATPPCSLDGHWYNELGSEMILITHANNSITGEYRTAVERCRGAAGTSHSSVYGMTSTTEIGSTVTLFVVWSSGNSVTNWVGQCNECGVNGSEVLMMSWLLRTKIDSCEDNWKSTIFGETIFTRHEPKQGPRRRYGIHAPGQAGEGAAKRQAPTCSANLKALATLPATLLSLISVAFFIFM